MRLSIVATLPLLTAMASVAFATQPKRHLTVNRWGMDYFEKPEAGLPEAGIFIFQETGLSFKLYAKLAAGTTASAKNVVCCNISPNMACSLANTCCSHCDVTVSDAGSGEPNFTTAPGADTDGESSSDAPMDPLVLALAIAVPILFVLCLLPLLMRFVQRRRDRAQSPLEPTPTFAPAALHPNRMAASTTSTVNSLFYVLPDVTKPHTQLDPLRDTALAAGRSRSMSSTAGSIATYEVNVEELPPTVAPFGSARTASYCLTPKDNAGTPLRVVFPGPGDNYV